MLSRLAAEIVGVLLLVAAALIGLHFYDAHQQAVGAATVSQAVREVANAATAANAATNTQRESDQRENLREANAQNTQRDADARDLDAFVQRVHDGAARGSRAAAVDPSASSPGDASGVPTATVVSADLYARAVAAARDAAKYADCLATAGQLCATDYHALTP